MSEISWGWEKLANILLWRLAPGGLVLTRRDLGALPQERVLVTDRQADRVKLSFVSINEALRLREALANSKEPVGVSPLEGRWEKIGAVMLWKLAKGGVTLSRWDHDAVPHDKLILAHGHRDGVEFRFMPRVEAARLTSWDQENERRLIHEAIQ